MPSTELTRDNAGGEPAGIAVAPHFRHGDAAEHRGRGDGDAGDRGKDRIGKDRGHAEARRHAPQQRAGRHRRCPCPTPETVTSSPISTNSGTTANRYSRRLSLATDPIIRVATVSLRIMATPRRTPGASRPNRHADPDQHQERMNGRDADVERVMPGLPSAQGDGLSPPAPNSCAATARPQQDQRPERPGRQRQHAGDADELRRSTVLGACPRGPGDPSANIAPAVRTPRPAGRPVVGARASRRRRRTSVRASRSWRTVEASCRYTIITTVSAPSSDTRGSEPPMDVARRDVGADHDHQHDDHQRAERRQPVGHTQ
jgi:hypothetical protein